MSIAILISNGPSSSRHVRSADNLNPPPSARRPARPQGRLRRVWGCFDLGQAASKVARVQP